MKKNYLLLPIIFCMLALNAYAKIKTPISINVDFTGEHQAVIELPRVESINISCKGKATSDYPDGYFFNGSSYQTGYYYGVLALSIAGPFDGDDRGDCKINYSDGSYDQVYFTLNNLVISYTKKNSRYYCYIEGNIGTGLDRENHSDDKLQAEYRNIENPCASDKSSPDYSYNKDTYIITPGHDWHVYNQGYITINVN